MKAVTRLTKTNEFCWSQQRARGLGQLSTFCKKYMATIHGKQIVISCMITFYYYKIAFCYNASRININNAYDQCSYMSYRIKVYCLQVRCKKCYGQKENCQNEVCHLILSTVYCVIFLIYLTHFVCQQHIGLNIDDETKTKKDCKIFFRLKIYSRSQFSVILKNLLYFL